MCTLHLRDTICLRRTFSTNITVIGTQLHVVESVVIICPLVKKFSTFYGLGGLYHVHTSPPLAPVLR
jgi:hypothetical protein